MQIKGSHMKNKALFSTLLVVLLCSYAEFAVRPTKAFNLDLIPQGQQGLSPEKKRTLPGIGPDEIFPESTPSEPGNRNSNDSNRSRPTTRSSPTPTPTAKPTPKPVQTPTAVLSIGVAESASPSPTPDTVPVVARQRVTSAPPSNWSLLAMSLLTLVIFVGLIYVLQKLKEKLVTSNSR